MSVKNETGNLGALLEARGESGWKPPEIPRDVMGRERWRKERRRRFCSMLRVQEGEGASDGVTLSSERGDDGVIREEVAFFVRGGRYAQRCYVRPIMTNHCLP
jgi:hypothetical protein